MEESAPADDALDAALWSAIVHTARDGIISIDQRGTVTCFNSAASEIFGYTAAEVVGRNVALLMPEPYRSTHDAHIERYQRTGEARAVGRIRHVQALHKSGRMFPIELSVGEAQLNGEPVYTGIVRDVERAQRRYRAVVDQAGVIILVLTPGGRVVEFNPEAERAYGWRSAEIIESDYLELCVPERDRAGVRAAMDRVLAGEVVRGFQNSILRCDGSERVVLWNSVRLTDEFGTATGIVAVGNDVTERQLAAHALAHAHGELQAAHKQLRTEQAKIVHAEKLPSIGQLASGVAHEVNNPLAGIMSCVDALRAGALSDRRRIAYYDAIEDGLDRIERIVRALLDYARPRGSGSPGAVDLHEAVDGCLLLVRPQQHKAGVSVELGFKEGEFIARGEQHALQQAIMNVLLNSLYAAPRGSTISIGAQVVDDRVELSLTDRGPGIPQSEIARVTDPFFTTKPEGEGTGLGLAVTLGIISRMGGLLRIDSADGGGTTVTFSLPLTDQS